MVASPAIRAMLQASREQLVRQVLSAREEALSSASGTLGGTLGGTEIIDQLFGAVPQGACARSRGVVIIPHTS